MIASLHSFAYKQNFMLLKSTNWPLHTWFSAGLWLVLDLVLCRLTSLRTHSTRRRPLTTMRRRMEKRPLPKTWATTSTSWLHRSVPPCPSQPLPFPKDVGHNIYILASQVSPSPPLPTPPLPQRRGPQHLHPGYTGQFLPSPPKTYATTSTSWLHRPVLPPPQKTYATTSAFWVHRSVPPTKLGTPLRSPPIRFNHVTDCTLWGVLLLVSNTLGLLCGVTWICFHATLNPYSIW